MLVDQFGRHIDYLRLSLTDRCNFRCTYCMPQDMTFAPRSENLHLDELSLIAQAFVDLGVKKIRLTGGEPLIHPDFDQLLFRLSNLEGLADIALTTNAALLAEKISVIKASKVTQMNISLDSLDKQKFSQITRSKATEFDAVMQGIDAAISAGIKRIRLNTVVSKGINDDELVALVNFAQQKGVHIAFIEEMPMGQMGQYRRQAHFLSNDDVKRRLQAHLTLLPQTQKKHRSGPAKYYALVGSQTQVGFISPHSQNFCASCNRVRVTRKGQLILCLGNDDSLDLRALIRSSSDPLASVKQAIKQAIQVKPKSHHFDVTDDRVQVVRFMSDTGG